MLWMQTDTTTLSPVNLLVYEGNAYHFPRACGVVFAAVLRALKRDGVPAQTVWDAVERFRGVRASRAPIALTYQLNLMDHCTDEYAKSLLFKYALIVQRDFIALCINDDASSAEASDGDASAEEEPGSLLLRTYKKMVVDTLEAFPAEEGRRLADAATEASVEAIAHAVSDMHAAAGAARKAIRKANRKAIRETA